MREKKLSRLSRTELLELLLAQTMETERLQRELEETRRQLEDRNLKLSQAGDLAQAALAVNGVFEAAQEAARQYLENIAAMEEETRIRCRQLLEEAGQTADTEETDEKNE